MASNNRVQRTAAAADVSVGSLSMARRTSIALFLLVALAWGPGCSPIRHAWQRQPAEAGVPMTEWPTLARGSHCRVDARSRGEATARLAEQSFVPLTPTDVSAYCATFAPPGDHGLAPYLVRGVAHPGPAYSVVHFDPSAGRCGVYQATYDGENMLGVWLNREVQPSPVIVYLPSEPVEVYPVAEMGGDWILNTKGFAEEQEYARSLCWDQTDFLMQIAAGEGGDLTNRCGGRGPAGPAADRSR